MAEVDIFGRPVDPGSATPVTLQDARRYREPAGPPPAELPATERPREYERGMRAVPMKTVLHGVLAIEQGKLRDSYLRLTDQQHQFIRVRTMVPTDAEARHILGRERDRSDRLYERACECRHHTPSWADFDEASVIRWKKQDDFKQVYDAVLHEPVLFAEVGMQSLAPLAVQAYHDLLQPGVRDSVRRMAAKDVVEAVELKPTIGVQPGSPGDPAGGRQSGFLYRMALSRYQRGIEPLPGDREILAADGIDIDRPTGGGEGTVRTLDGDDVIEGTFREVPRGGDNSEFLPD